MGSFGWWMVTKWAPLKEHLEEGTLGNYQVAADHLLREIGDVQISQLDATALTQALNRVAAHRKKTKKKVRSVIDGKKVESIVETDWGTISASLVNKCRSIGLEVVELASDAGACKRINPKFVPRRKDPAKKVAVYSPKEMRLLYETCADSIVEVPTLLGGFLGLTINEARALRSENLSHEGVLDVGHLMKRSGARSTKMKTDYRPRMLKLPPGLLTEIRRHAAPGGFLCRSSNGELVSESNIDRSLNAKMERVGLRRLTFHQLRHCFSSWLEENGCPNSVRLAIMGQSTASVKDRYNHATPKAIECWIGAFWDASLEPWEEGEKPQPKSYTWGGPRISAAGSKNGRSKLKAGDIPEIRRRLAVGETPYAIAKAYDVDAKAIRQIAQGATWKDAA